jgi:signal transduction histidine kinase
MSFVATVIVAIEMMIPQMVSISDRTRRILMNSVKEIKQLSEKLRNRPEALVVEPSQVSQIEDLVFLPAIVEYVIGQKQFEYCQKRIVQSKLKTLVRGSEGFVKVNSAELRAILSNLINNAIEAYADGGGRVEVVLSTSGGFCSISIQDYGCGIPTEYLKDLGSKQITFKGGVGRGLGLLHAAQTVEAWGGTIAFDSEVGSGTKATLQLIRFEPHLSERTNPSPSI